ncbi:MAG: hypothetical protein JHD16_08945 [Solirubrobacteraceae bacterium]|nr:hypothetical protein [Solirubrobacteraceae bacterium]
MTRLKSLGVLARASLQLGDQTGADEYGASCDDLAAELAPAWPAAQRHALATRAWVAVHHGDGQAAREAGEIAVRAAREAGAELEAIELQLVCARARGLTGDLDGAARELRALQAVLAQVGAVRLQADAERELRRLGRGPVSRRERATAGGAARLTARQRQVAELAAAGRSNREIAEALVLSVKTVESHLGAAFTTLGVRSRPQLREHLG